MSILQKALRPCLAAQPCRNYRAAFSSSSSTQVESPLYNDTSDLIDAVNDFSPHPPTPPPGAYAAPNPIPQSYSSTVHAVTQKPMHRLHVNASPNNTILTFTRDNGDTIGWFSGGKCGFKGVNRSGYEAGYQCTVRMFDRIAEEAMHKPMSLEIIFKGFGQGRDALYSALKTSEGEKIRKLVVRMSDRTPIKIGGTRAKKARRL